MSLFGKNNDQNGRGDENQNRGDPSMRLMFGAVISAYLIYLGYDLLKSAVSGAEGMPLWAAYLFGIAFIAVGAGYLLMKFRAYREYKNREEEEAGEVQEDGAAEAEEMLPDEAGENETGEDGPEEKPEQAPAEEE